MNTLYWIDETGPLCDGMGLACISKLYLLRMGGGGGRVQRGGAVNKGDGRPLKGVCEGGSRVGGI